MYYIGQTYKNMGEIRRAKKAYKEVMTTYPDHVVSVYAINDLIAIATTLKDTKTRVELWKKLAFDIKRTRETATICRDASKNLASYHFYMVAFVDYGESDLWPETADGLGPSLERISPALEETDPRGWAASVPVGGTPSRVNSVRIVDAEAPQANRSTWIERGAEFRYFRGTEAPPGINQGHTSCGFMRFRCSERALCVNVRDCCNIRDKKYQ